MVETFITLPAIYKSTRMCQVYVGQLENDIDAIYIPVIESDDEIDPVPEKKSYHDEKLRLKISSKPRKSRKRLSKVRKFHTRFGVERLMRKTNCSFD